MIKFGARVVQFQRNKRDILYSGDVSNTQGDSKINSRTEFINSGAIQGGGDVLVMIFIFMM